MFYLEIIYKTILSIIVNLLSFKISILPIILFLIFSYLFFLLLRNIKKINFSYKFIIISIRISILLLLLPLFENNNFKFEEIKKERQNIGIIIDNSKSILNTYFIFIIFIY